jgi:hypothetical protein
MQQPDFLQAFFAAVIVDKINENNPDYKPFFPNMQTKANEKKDFALATAYLGVSIFSKRFE